MFNLPTYRITPNAHPIKCSPQCPSPSHPNPLPTSLSTTPCSFPRVRSLSCSVTLSHISTHFLSFPLYSLSLTREAGKISQLHRVESLRFFTCCLRWRPMPIFKLHLQPDFAVNSWVSGGSVGQKSCFWVLHIVCVGVRSFKSAKTHLWTFPTSKLFFVYVFFYYLLRIYV